jgi:hypothetical protein
MLLVDSVVEHAVRDRLVCFPGFFKRAREEVTTGLPQANSYHPGPEPWKCAKNPPGWPNDKRTLAPKMSKEQAR